MIRTVSICVFWWLPQQNTHVYIGNYRSSGGFTVYDARGLVFCVSVEVSYPTKHVLYCFRFRTIRARASVMLALLYLLLVAPVFYPIRCETKQNISCDHDNHDNAQLYSTTTNNSKSSNDVDCGTGIGTHIQSNGTHDPTKHISKLSLIKVAVLVAVLVIVIISACRMMFRMYAQMGVREGLDGVEKDWNGSV